LKGLFRRSRLVFAAALQRPLAGFFATALLLAGCVAAPQDQAGGSAYGASLLWQVDTEGQAPSYVLGTMHSPDPRLRDLRPEVRGALEASETVAFELLFDEIDPERMVQATLQPAGWRLEDDLGAELFARTAAVARRYGVLPEQLQRMTVFTLVGLLSYPPEEFRRLALGEPILDLWLQQEAQSQGKNLRSLETDEEQLSLFTGLSKAERIVLVTGLLEDISENVYGRMIEAYLAGDLAALMAEVYDFSGVTDIAAAERFLKRLLDDRNRIMVERMAPLVQQGPTFVAVGAAHLGGEAGILALLEQRGYRVRRLP